LSNQKNALEAIINTANGIPRIINKLCNASLMIGHSKEVSEINNDVVLIEIKETELVNVWNVNLMNYKCIKISTI